MSSTTANAALAQLRLLQLASPALPVGAYAYSQGLEWAVAAGWVHDEETLAAWLQEQLEYGLANVDLPLLDRLYGAALADDAVSLARHSRALLARRDTRELRADDCDRGRALARLLRDLGIAAALPWVHAEDAPYAAVLVCACVTWSVSRGDCATAYAWGWLENQVLAGVKLVPLGQVAGQRLLLQLAPAIPAAIDHALSLEDDDIGATLPALAIASCLHETQYTRLFRS